MIHELHISFASLERGECTSCHLLSGAEKEEHLQEVRRRRKSYENNADRATCFVGTAGSQKVSMLPRMEMFTKAAFRRRMVALNHLFVLAGGSAPTKPVIANAWHKAIAGRTVSEMTTSMMAFLTHDAFTEADRISN